MERQLPLCTASTPARDTRLDDAQDGYGSPRTMHAAGIALRHAVGRPPTAPRHASRGFKEFLFLVAYEVRNDFRKQSIEFASS